MEVKEMRRLSGMTQAAFAAFFGVPKRSVENWEYGKSECPLYLADLMQYKLEREGILKPEELGDKKMVTIKKYAKDHGYEPDAILCRIQLGSLPGVNVNGEWMIDSKTPITSGAKGKDGNQMDIPLRWMDRGEAMSVIEKSGLTVANFIHDLKRMFPSLSPSAMVCAVMFADLDKNELRFKARDIENLKASDAKYFDRLYHFTACCGEVPEEFIAAACLMLHLNPEFTD